MSGFINLSLYASNSTPQISYKLKWQSRISIFLSSSSSRSHLFIWALVLHGQPLIIHRRRSTLISPQPLATSTETLKSDPRSTTADLKGLAVIALEAEAEHANTTWSAIAKLKMKTNSTGEGDEGRLVSSLDVCMEEFSEASENLRAAADRLHGPVNQLVSAAMTDAVTCEDAMEEAGYGSFLAERSGYFMKLCSNALAIVLLLSNNH